MPQRVWLTIVKSRRVTHSKAVAVLGLLRVIQFAFQLGGAMAQPVQRWTCDQ